MNSTTEHWANIHSAQADNRKMKEISDGSIGQIFILLKLTEGR